MNEQKRISVVSSDLNGTLVHQHTMSDMIRLYLGEEKFQKANAVFKRQTSGKASMEEAFSTAGPLTRGLTLRQAIGYTQEHMKYVNGFSDFVNHLSQRDIPFVINSTGYSVTIYAIREKVEDKIHGQIGNRLVFGTDADPRQALRENELEAHVRKFFTDPQQPVYDRLQATGEIELGIQDEAAKVILINEYCARHFPNVKPNEIVHIGDTMGDSGGIIGIAKQGGIGIAFNYNEALEDFLRTEIAKEDVFGRVSFVDKKSKTSDLRNVTAVLKSLQPC